MKVKITKKTSNELKIEVEDAGHTLCNLLQKNLLGDANVDLAGYEMPHPLASSAIIYVRTKKGVDPEEVLLKAIKKTREINNEFGRELKKVLKKT